MKRTTVLAASAWLLAVSHAFAEPAADNAAEAAREWSAYIAPMPSIGERMVPLMSDPQNPQLRQELYGMLFSGMSQAYMGLFLGDPDHPEFWPFANQAYNFGSPNPDNDNYVAPLDGAGVYRISGFRGTVRIVDFQIGSGMLFSNGTGTPGLVLANYDIDKLNIDKKDGSFEFILSAERPAGYKGDWWKLDAKAKNIVVRQVAYDRLHEVDARLAIERLDRPAIRPRPSAEEIEANLKLIPVWAENWTKMSMQWPIALRAKGFVNKVDVHPLPNIGGHTRQKYIEGLFEIGPDEALIYETEVPKQCRFWNVVLTDMLWRVIDYTNRQSNLNGHTAKLDKDGKFRAVISATDPGVPNWLDSAGYTKGAITGRWFECSSEPTPSITKVKLAEVRNHLPADTPVISAEARDAAIRLRRKGAQLRRRW